MNNQGLNKKIMLELDEDLALWFKRLCEELALMKTNNMVDKLNAQKVIGKIILKKNSFIAFIN